MQDALSSSLSGPDKRHLIEAQADAIAALLQVDPEAIQIDSHGVSLNPRQAAALIALAQQSAAR